MLISYARSARVRTTLFCVTSALLCASVVAHADAPRLSPQTAQVSGSSARAPHTFSLANGLDVVVVEDHRFASAAVHVEYHVGFRDDPPNRIGMGRLFEHLLEHPSTRHVRHYMRTDVLRALGAPTDLLTNVVVTEDVTHVSTRVPTDSLELALYLESDRMGFLADGLTQESIEPLRNEIEHDFAEIEDLAFGRFVPVLYRALYGPDHRYGNMAGVLPNSLDGLRMREVLERKRDYYGPGNATLVVMGDFDGTRVEEQVKRFFDPLLKSPRVAAPARALPVLPGEKRVAMEANIARPALVLSWPTPALFTADDSVLDIVARVLTSRAQSKRAAKAKTAVHLIARQASRELGSEFHTFSTLADGQDFDTARAVVENEIRELSTNDPTQQEVTRELSGYITQSALGHVSLFDRARHAADCRRTVGDAGFFDKYIAGYTNIGPQDVKRVAAQYLHPTRRVVMTIGPNAQAPAAGRIVEGNKP